MFKLLADFNEIEDGVVKGLLEDATGPRPLRVKDRVLLHDDGEHEVWGVVGNIEKGLVSVTLDWDTWGPAGRYRIQSKDSYWVISDFDLSGVGNSALIPTPTRVEVPVPTEVFAQLPAVGA